MTDICALDDLEDGGVRRFELDGTAIAVVRIGDDVYAIDDICSHAHVSLSDGDVWCDELELECPKHASAFNLITGEPSSLPATQPVKVFVTRVDGGRVSVSDPEACGSNEGTD